MLQLEVNTHVKEDEGILAGLSMYKVVLGKFSFSVLMVVL
jgi:hypothetical protein